MRPHQVRFAKQCLERQQMMTENEAGRVRLTVEGDPSELLGLLRAALTKLERRPARLNAEAAADIRRRHAEGESQASLARAYGVTTQSIKNIVRGKTWRD